MNDDPSKKRLGRGLAALIGDIDRPVVERSAPIQSERNIPIEFVTRNPRNPCRMFSEVELEDLAQSIKEHAVEQLIVLGAAPGNPDHYELVAGERRWRASQLAGV